MESIWPEEEKITTIVPAYNEEEFIVNVARQLKIAQNKGFIHEIIVISDGSTDKTVDFAHNEGVKVIELSENKGKSWAFAAGAHASKSNNSTIMLMVDADLKEIRPEQLHYLIQPLIDFKETDMVVGTVEGDLTGISGQRAIRVRSLEPLYKNSRTWQKKLFLSGYGLEVALYYILIRQQIAPTDFVTARPAEGKKLSVKKQVDVTNMYISDRTLLANMLREQRLEVAPMHPKNKHALYKKLLTWAKNKEEARYNYYLSVLEDLSQE